MIDAALTEIHKQLEARAAQIEAIRMQLNSIHTDNAKRERFTRLITQTLATFGSLDKAVSWLTTKNRLLKGESPIEFLDSDDRIEQIHDILWRIDHGVTG